MNCPNCGLANAQGAKFCANCGTPLSGALPPPPSYQSQSQNQQNQSQYQPPPAYQAPGPYRQAPVAPPAGSTTKNIAIGCLAVLLVFLFFGLSCTRACFGRRHAYTHHRY